MIKVHFNGYAVNRDQDKIHRSIIIDLVGKKIKKFKLEASEVMIENQLTKN